MFLSKNLLQILESTMTKRASRPLSSVINDNTRPKWVYFISTGEYRCLVSFGHNEILFITKWKSEISLQKEFTVHEWLMPVLHLLTSGVLEVLALPDAKVIIADSVHRTHRHSTLPMSLLISAIDSVDNTPW